MSRAPRPKQCFVCGERYQSGHPYTSHMRKHVREGRAIERRETEFWYVGSRYHERTVTVFEAVKQEEAP